MIGHADAYGLARGMRYPARHFTSGFQNKRPGTRRSQFKETVLLIVYSGEMADFGPVATKQRQVVAFVTPPQAPQGIGRPLVAPPRHNPTAAARRNRHHTPP